MIRRRSRRSEERRRAFLVALFKLSMALGLGGVALWYAYEVGYKVAQGEVGTLHDQLQQANDEIRKQTDQAMGARAALAETQKQTDELRSQYELVRPSDDMKDILSLVRAKLAEGMDPKRLALVIRSARNPRECDAPVIKRFLVRTPHYKGAPTNTAVRLADVVTVSADGIGANGGKESWFDPDMPVKLHIAADGTKSSEITGKLPLEQLVAVKNVEVHFTVSLSANRGFVEVASERCEYR